MTRRTGLRLGLGALVVLLSLGDLVLGPRATWSHVLTGLGLVLTLPWIVDRARLHTRKAKAMDERSLVQRLLTMLVPVVMIGACLVAKWSVASRAMAGSADPAVYASAYRTYGALAFSLSLLGLLGTRRVQAFLSRMADHPARLTLVSFGIGAVVGAVLLTLPMSLRDPAKASFVDGLFMATSALCVTGLAPFGVAATYTPFGQGVLLVLVQLGGLGIMVLSAFLSIVVGQRMQTRATAVMAEMIDADSFEAFRRTVVVIVASTLFIEALGAVALWGLFEGHLDVGLRWDEDSPMAGAGDTRWAAVFHAVSAFCNAGFSLCRDGLVPFSGSPGVLGVIMVLIVVGGIGFPVLDELLRRLAHKLQGKRPPRLSLHARAALLATAFFLAAGAVMFLVLEWGQTMRGMPVWQKLLAAIFQSVTTRTAGFNSLDFGAMRPATLFITCALMFVGGSPASTAGGIKTTTIYVLYASLKAELTGLAAPRMLGRSLGAATVRKAAGLTFLSLGIVSVLVIALMLTDRHEPHRLLFEAVSAFGTAGLSTNLTPELSVPGRLVVTLAMFIGRIGPMTLALALSTESREVGLALPEERIGIG